MKNDYDDYSDSDSGDDEYEVMFIPDVYWQCELLPVLRQDYKQIEYRIDNSVVDVDDDDDEDEAESLEIVDKGDFFLDYNYCFNVISTFILINNILTKKFIFYERKFYQLNSIKQKFLGNYSYKRIFLCYNLLPYKVLSPLENTCDSDEYKYQKNLDKQWKNTIGSFDYNRLPLAVILVDEATFYSDEDYQKLIASINKTIKKKNKKIEKIEYKEKMKQKNNFIKLQLKFKRKNRSQSKHKKNYR